MNRLNRLKEFKSKDHGMPGLFLIKPEISNGEKFLLDLIESNPKEFDRIMTLAEEKHVIFHEELKAKEAEENYKKSLVLEKIDQTELPTEVKDILKKLC
jgi:hypothetical protein